MSTETVRDAVTEYYSETLKSYEDLKTNACCAATEPPAHLKPILAKIHTEVHMKFYGCGSPIPEALEGLRVLDLGCGTGRDCVVIAKLVGDTGQVVGVDMTDEQLEIANRWLPYHEEKLEIKPGVLSFVKGHMEDLAAIGLEDNSFDLVISNCVLNLSADKDKLFSEIFRVLKPGGELFFSDVFADRRIPSHLANDPVLLGECLGGAMYTEDFRRMMIANGCPDYRTVSTTPLAIEDGEIFNKIGMVQFTSDTVRVFKIASLEDRCEDFGQIATYKTPMLGHPHAFELDDHHYFELGKPMRVCGNSAAMLSETRYKKYFEVLGDKSTHFGLFASEEPMMIAPHVSGGGCC
ncbi:MAG: methyltransferase domain-containing protein [Bdellovibrionales bacterium]|nr:methyltransferase domain-containing protein [Bdellovibrionales bacterium]